MKPAIDGLQFGYDYSDQPTVLSGSAAGAYRYDGHFKRVKSTVNGKIIYNVFDASGTLIHIDNVTDHQQTDLVGRVARITNNVVTYLHPDPLGSAQAGTNASGAIAWSEQYTPFGETIQRPPANDNQAGYTGHIQDKATGLTYMQARYYDAALGRFLSVDPVDPVESSDYDLNLYAYVGNDPVNKTDPNGEESACFGSSCGPFPEVTAAQAAGTIADFTPVVGDVKGIVEAIADPSVANIAAAAVGVVPVLGDVAGKAIKGADKIAAKSVPHGNKVDGRPATLYEKYDKDGNFRKHGVTKHEDPSKRYTSKQIDDGKVVRTDRGPRGEMIKKERDLVETNPGPDNRERWAGKRRPE